MATQKDISKAIIHSGLTGKIICLHSSLKSFGFVEGGADAIIETFLEQKCTLVVPTFYYDAIAPTPADRRIAQNGYDYSEETEVKFEEIKPYDGADSTIVRDMGAIPAAILKKDGRVRGNHPINSLSAIGPKAKEIIEVQTPMEVYAPYEVIYKKYDAFLLLAGVGLTRATPIHFAEKLAGRRLFRKWAKISQNDIVETQVGSCSEGFDKFEPYVKGIEASIRCGDGTWKIYPFREFVSCIAEVVRTNAFITHCGDTSCIRCNDSIKGGPIL